MTQDGVIVQPGDASPTGNEGGATSTTVEAPPKAEPSMEERIATIAAEKVQEALAKEREAFAKEREASRREIQSAKDKAIAEARKAAAAERTSQASLRIIQETDPDRVKDIELARYKAQDDVAKEAEVELEQQRKMVEFREQFNTRIKARITDMGVDLTDKRLDWAEDAPNALEAQDRILASVAKIKKDDDANLKASVKKQVADAINQARRELGLDSVDTSGGGVTANGTWLKQWVSGELPATKDNIRKAEKLLNS